MRVCKHCHKRFKPSSGHKNCPSCRNKLSKVKCMCGKRIQQSSKCCVNCFTQVGTANHNWKGGKTYTKKGYVMRYAPTHPRSVNNSGYVFEHILAIEKKLGRYLFKNENVHHKNGLKADNRLKNLELWSRAQPSGTRVKDLVKFAKDILMLYKPSLLA